MKKIGVILGSMLLLSTVTVGNAMAAPVNPSALGALQGELNYITTGGISSVDVTADYLGATQDSTWKLTATGGSVTTMIIEIAGFANQNILGVYDSSDSSKQVNLFAGSANAGDQVTLSIMATGVVKVNQIDTGVVFAGNSFGYFLDSSANSGGGIFYSNTSLNVDGQDHMLAYQGTGDEVTLPGYNASDWTANEFILAFEDLNGLTGSDWDYTDMVVMVESVKPVPEPATMLLFGTGLVGLAGFGSRRRSRNNV